MLSILLAAQEAGASASLFEKFGVNWPFFTAQLLNFIIVLVVLKCFAFGPIIAMLEQRKNRIAEGEEKLKRIEKQLAESEATTAAALEKANNDSKRLIEEARDSAALITEQKTQEAIASAQNIISKAQDSAKAEQAHAATELRREFGRLVTLTTANVTGKVLSENDKARINEEALATIQS